MEDDFSKNRPREEDEEFEFEIDFDPTGEPEEHRPTPPCKTYTREFSSDEELVQWCKEFLEKNPDKEIAISERFEKPKQ